MLEHALALKQRCNCLRAEMVDATSQLASQAGGVVNVHDVDAAM